MYPYNKKKSKGGQEVPSFQLIPGGTHTEAIQCITTGPSKGIYEVLPKEAPNFAPNARWQHPTHAVLPCKGEREFVKFSRYTKPENDWMYPSTGYARGQKKGIAYDKFKPIDTPILGIPGNFDVYKTNVLGGLK